MSILESAKEIIYGDREQTYGSPDKNLQLIADYWNVHLGLTHITPEDVCIMMTLLKLARLKNTPAHKGTQIDVCGYMALLERIQDHYVKALETFKNRKEVEAAHAKMEVFNTPAQ